MKLLFLSMHYAPEPCDSRTSHLARLMAERGHRAQALTSFPNYPYGQIYDGYRQRLCSRQMVEGVEVVRVPMFPDHSMSIKRRTLSYFSFGASSAFLGTFFTQRPDLIWIHHPPLTTAFAGYVIARVKRVPYVLEIHDLWPETLVSTGMIKEGRLTRSIRKVCDFLHRRAAAIVVTSPGMKDNLVRHGTDSRKIRVFPQFSDESMFHPVDRDEDFGREQGLKGFFNVVFAGNIGTAQSLDVVLEAAEKLRHIPEVRFVILGEGVERARLDAEARHRGLDNVRFLGHRPSAEMPSYFAWADALLVHLKEDPLFAITIPGKTQAYLASGRPILCGVAGDTAEIVRSAGAGLTFRPDDADELADAIRRLRAMPMESLERMGAAGMQAAAEQFGKEALASRYESLFERLVVEHQAKSLLRLPSAAKIAQSRSAQRSSRSLAMIPGRTKSHPVSDEAVCLVETAPAVVRSHSETV